jgi:hypothetical protein
MAKKTNGGKKKALAARTRIRQRAMGQPRQLANPRLEAHINMVLDPCNSALAPNAYRGKDGFVNRFAASFDLTANTNPCGVVAFWPRYNRVFLLGLATNSTVFAMDFYGLGGYVGPGGAYLGTNASETRPIGACITSDYVGTELDRQGQVITGVVPYKAVAGGSLTIAGLKQLLQVWRRTPDEPAETKWIPSPSDEDYQAISATLPAIYGDDNIIVHVFDGFAANKMVFNNRVVAIHEWQPFWGLGITVPTPNTPDTPAGLERVRTVLAGFGNWWTHGGKESAKLVARLAAAGVRAYYGDQSGALRVGGAAAIEYVNGGKPRQMIAAA